MKPVYLAQLNTWCVEEINALKAKGATDADLQEPAFAILLFQQIAEHHSDQIRADPEFSEVVFHLFFDKASPAELRKLAAEYRLKERHRHLAYDLEVEADKRERGV